MCTGASPVSPAGPTCTYGMRSPSMDTASCRVTTSPSAVNVRGACFSTIGDLPGSIKHHRGRRDRVLRVGEQVAVALDLSMSKRQTLTTPISGSPDSLERAQPSDDGVRTSNTGFSSSRIEQHQLPVAPEEVLQCAPLARLEQDRESAVPARNAASDIPSTVSGA